MINWLKKLVREPINWIVAYMLITSVSLLLCSFLTGLQGNLMRDVIRSEIVQGNAILQNYQNEIVMQKEINDLKTRVTSLEKK